MSGASCQPGPSPTARALRLEGLRADGPESLRQLLERLPEPPWDAEVEAGSPLGGLLRGAGFEPYMEAAVMARRAEGLPRAPLIPGLRIEPYRNDWAGTFTTLEGLAMADLAAFREMGQPTGYEQAEGYDSFNVAIRDQQMIGFAQAMLPEGWINWMGVAPEFRRGRVGHQLIEEMSRQVTQARGTHLAALVELGGPGPAFLGALGFRQRGTGKVLMIRRAESG